MSPFRRGERTVALAKAPAENRVVLKSALQRLVLRTANGPLSPVYRGLYRAPARLARLWLPEDVVDVAAIRSVEDPGFVVGLSDIDLLAILRSGSGPRHVAAVAAIARLNPRLRRVFPFFQYCFSVTEQELQLPAADHWLAVHGAWFRSRLPDSTGRVPFARCLALRHACRWMFREATMPALLRKPRSSTLVNHQRRAFRILRELSFGLGLVDETPYDEAHFARWQCRVAAATGLPHADAATVAEASAWYASPEGGLAIWRFARDAARAFDWSAGGPASKEPAGIVPSPSWLAPVADAFRTSGVTVVAGGSGERECDDEAYLLLDEEAEVCSRRVDSLARRWEECRQRVPGIVTVAPMLVTPSLLRWLAAVCPWRAAVLREGRDTHGRRLAAEVWPWERHARLAWLYPVCRDFREDLQGTPDEVASIVRCSLPRVLLEASAGDAPATASLVQSSFVERFGADAWGHDSLRDASIQLEKDRGGLEERLRLFAAAIPLADAAFGRLLATVTAMPPPESLPMLSGSSALLDRLRGDGGD